MAIEIECLALSAFRLGQSVRAHSRRVRRRVDVDVHLLTNIDWKIASCGQISAGLSQCSFSLLRSVAPQFAIFDCHYALFGQSFGEHQLVVRISEICLGDNSVKNRREEGFGRRRPDLVFVPRELVEQN